MNKKNILEEIGLTKRETEFYRLLLSMGETKITKLQEILGFHPQVVYRVARSLQTKGLVSLARKRKALHAIAESPEELVQIEQRRLEKIKEQLPSLLALQKRADTPFIHTSKGIDALRAFREKAYRSLEKRQVYYIIGGSGERYYKAMGEHHQRIEQIRVGKKIQKKIISSVSEKEKFQKDSERKCTEVKFLGSEFPIMSSTNIFGETVGVIIWAEEPVIITIKSHEIATNYKQYFRELWRLANN